MNKCLRQCRKHCHGGHFIELITIKDDTKRLYYQQMGIAEHWSVRELREQQDKLAYERSLKVRWNCI